MLHRKRLNFSGIGCLQSFKTTTAPEAVLI